MQALVVYGSRHGGTEALAGMVADSLERRGFRPDLRPAWPPADIPGFELVVVGGAVRGGRWHPAAARFVRSRSEELEAVPVYFFSTIRLNASGRLPEPVVPADLGELMQRVDAADHATFGECLGRHRSSTGLASMRRRLEDICSPEVIDSWVERMCRDLATTSGRTT